MAPVGQASIQRVHDPQRATCGGSAGSSRVVKISARKNQVPKLATEQHRALPVPADPSLGREIALQHRAGIDIKPLLPSSRGEERIQLSQLCLYDLVVIIAPRITGNPARVRSVRLWPSRLVALPVIHRQRHD